MGDRSLSYGDILEIVRLIESSSHFTEFHLKFGDIEIDLQKAGAASAPAHKELPSPKAGERTDNGESGVVQRPSAECFPEGAILIKSPMVGTFYRAPEPGAPPFVDVGQAVTADTTVCIIEVMKLMNSIPAGCSGVVSTILVNDGEPVEFGQVIMVISPDGSK